MHRPEKAIQVFQKIIDDFPGDRWAGYSSEKLEELGK
jgi:outer membrane protein assembly factor BamD (BamD/ComL family)